jgi:hypothetical protein
VSQEGDRDLARVLLFLAIDAAALATVCGLLIILGVLFGWS